MPLKRPFPECGAPHFLRTKNISHNYRRLGYMFGLIRHESQTLQDKLELLAEHEVDLAAALASPHFVETVCPVDAEEAEHAEVYTGADAG